LNRIKNELRNGRNVPSEVVHTLSIWYIKSET